MNLVIRDGRIEALQVLGLSIVRKQAPPGTHTVEESRGWYRLVTEPVAGAWQRNIIASTESVLSFAAVYACVTLIASDIGKLRIKLVERDDNGIWTETENAAHSPVLRKPNRYQTRIKFIEQWIASKFIHGNAYILKERDHRGVVVALYVLDPRRVRVQVAPDGSVFYALATDNLAGITESVVVPAREIIHDVMVPLYHPLCGVSPITACGLAATQGLRVQHQSASFFGNGSVPGGVVSYPDDINPDQAKDIQERWEAGFSGENAGRVAVLGRGAKFEQMAMKAVDAQLIEQLKWTGENVCTAFHVPPYMVGIGPPPNYNNIEALNIQYYAQCLQNPIESLELLLDEGLELKKNETGRSLGTEMDLDDLLRMDTATRVRTAHEAIQGGMAPNEARKRFYDLGPKKGGDSPYLQQQMFSLEALARRDEQGPPPPTVPPSTRPTPPGDDEDADRENARDLADFYRKELAAA